MFLSMSSPFNSIEAFTFLKCLNTLLKCDANKVNEQRKKRSNKIYLRSNYSEAYFKKLPHLPAMQLQHHRLQVHLNFLMLIAKLKCLNLLRPLSLPSPRTCISVFHSHSHLSWDTCAHFTCSSMKLLREHMVKNQRWSSGSFTMLWWR